MAKHDPFKDTNQDLVTTMPSRVVGTPRSMATLVVLGGTDQNLMRECGQESACPTARLIALKDTIQYQMARVSLRLGVIHARLIVLRDAIQDPVIFAIHSDWAILSPFLFPVFLSWSLPFYFGGLDILRIDVRIIVHLASVVLKLVHISPPSESIPVL